MAARKKDPVKQAKPEEVVDAEFVEATPAAPKRAPKAAKTAKKVVEAEVVEADSEESAESAEEVEPAVDELEEVNAEEIEVKPAKSSGGTGLARRDPLSSYMAEVTKHPLLTREEEVALAKRYRDTGDVKAAYRLVASNLRLVVKLAHEYHRNPLSLLDLVQEGNIGLMQAVKKFDPERGVKLSSYAAWWIRAYILRYIMDNWKMVKLGTTEAQRKLFFKLRQEQERLLKQGIEVTPKLLAERLNVTEQDVVEMDQRLGNDEMSLDAPVGGSDDDKTTRGDRFLPSGQQGADEALGNSELKELFRTKLAKFSEGLNEKDRYIFEKRLTADEPMTLQDIGAHYGVSRERARQLEAALMDRMRKYMREEIPDFDLVAEAERD
ncbi:MAG TPA: RNA polymerase factor sigma-32 [Archangium sp.]